ncbi:stonustoxin subunit alpha-like [Scomber scombrus]|uniref:stonustoxin subunit alpha-like n=1 Tax=Scomber scombrus TaxID=13677 RepID=UPI002DD8AF57|nr:stonustoxin subunit alpha-like [Scomber scombrus]
MSKVAAKVAGGTGGCVLPQREKFLPFWVDLTLDPDTANSDLTVSADRKVVERGDVNQVKTDNPKRFLNFPELLCEQPLTGKKYWEIEWDGLQGVGIAVSYQIIPRKTTGNECRFGRNTYSWSLEGIVERAFMHNNTCNDKVKSPISSHRNRVGVFLDKDQGILQYFAISPDLEDMVLLYEAPRSEKKFTEALYAGFWVVDHTRVTLCPKQPGPRA